MGTSHLYRSSSGLEGDLRSGEKDSPLIVFVHGALDRGASFARAARRLEEFSSLAYDRRGYGRSRSLRIANNLLTHRDDLLKMVGEADSQVLLVGHSLGAIIAASAAAIESDNIAGMVLYEPPGSWFGYSVLSAPTSSDPALEAEKFFRIMVGDAVWERLTEKERQERRLDGPALLADLRSLDGDAPFTPSQIRVPTLLAHGGKASNPRHVAATLYLATQIPGARVEAYENPGHGIHLSHPDLFSEIVRKTIAGL